MAKLAEGLEGREKTCKTAERAVSFRERSRPTHTRPSPPPTRRLRFVKRGEVEACLDFSDGEVVVVDR